jgi:RimJ/RimL family protein N-acetyltransferase
VSGPAGAATGQGIRPVTDGIVTVRQPAQGDAALLISGRDEEFRRWLGPGSRCPDPTGCVVAGGQVVGWVDYDTDRPWLNRGAVNIGYNLFAAHRGRGYATRAVRLLVHHLAIQATVRNATLLIHPDNRRSLAVARRAGFAMAGVVNGQPLLSRQVPPVSYTDGVVTIRRQRADDVAAEVSARDAEQFRWLSLPGDQARWAAMSEDQRRAHCRRLLLASRAVFGMGPKWTFSVDTGDVPHVGYVDCDLASSLVPAGQANISYAAHPAHRGRGHISRAVRLITRFLADHTGAQEAHILVDEGNIASLRVARAVDAAPTARWVDESGRTLIRHVLQLANS